MESRALFVIVAVVWMAAGPGAAVAEAQCTDNSACGFLQYCQKNQGDCDGQGVCSVRPVACPDIWDPVCGCDDITYGNSCEAAYIGINVASEGECPAPRCLNNDTCASGMFCLKSSGDCNGDGQCSEQPTMCPLYWDPVCGCDGFDYANGCLANQAGVSIAYEGECLTACATSDDCLHTEYCDTAHNGCGEPGACRLKPDFCTEQYDPVCGCNEVTFDNACLAAQTGVTVFKTGTCGPCPFTSSRTCIFTDACESGGTARWSGVVGD